MFYGFVFNKWLMEVCFCFDSWKSDSDIKQNGNNGCQALRMICWFMTIWEEISQSTSLGLLGWAIAQTWWTPPQHWFDHQKGWSFNQTLASSSTRLESKDLFDFNHPQIWFWHLVYIIYNVVCFFKIDLRPYYCGPNMSEPSSQLVVKHAHTHTQTCD